MAVRGHEYTKVGWEDLHNARVPRPAGYEHPWPTNAPYVSRVYSGALGCDHMAFTICRIGPGESGEHHRHVLAEEVHLLLEGTCKMRIGDEIVEARPLDAICVPADVYRSFYNDSDAPCRWLVMAGPIDEFIEASPDYLPEGERDPDANASGLRVDAFRGQTGGGSVYTVARWDELPDNPKVPWPNGYRHPWPSDQGYVSRDYDLVLDCDHLAFCIDHLDPGQAGQHHRHAQAEEVHVLIAGSCRMQVGDEQFDVRQDEAVRVPAPFRRSFYNDSSDDCWWVVIGAPVDEFREPTLAAYHAANTWDDEGDEPV